MYSRPVVSIVIPCYNAARHLAAAIESALSQTWSDKEIIVVDDGSIDESLTIARQFEDQGVLVLSHKNCGASAARNVAYNRSAGRYIKFLDADDILHPKLIERQMERLNGNTTAVASAEW